MAETDLDDDAFDENDIDALDNIAADAYQQRADAAATEKAFGAIERLAEVLCGVRDEKHTINESTAFCEQLRRLAQIAEDYFAARGDG